MNYEVFIAVFNKNQPHLHQLVIASPFASIKLVVGDGGKYADKLRGKSFN